MLGGARNARECVPWACALTLLSIAGCASINPVLAPARVLPARRVALDVGPAYQASVAAPDLQTAHDAMQRAAQGSPQPGDREAVLRGASVFAPSSPGIAPYTALRVGLGSQWEAHVAQMGPATRLGARRVVWSDADEKWALSLGVQARLSFWPGFAPEFAPDLKLLEAQHGGLDVQAVLGRTSSEIYDLFLAARVGYTAQHAALMPGMGPPLHAWVHRLDTALTAGLRVGFGRLSAALELSLHMNGYWGSVGALSLSSFGVSLVPATALSFGF